ncbi:MAG: hypothetical protein ACPGU4_08765 [Flavobacteriales bacterium]
MGLLFVLIFQLILIGILGLVISGIATSFAYSKTRKKRKRKLFLSATVPFIGLYSLYFLTLFSSIIVSEQKHIDIGIGDAWYLPLPEDCEFLMIDVTDEADIIFRQEAIVSRISHMQLVGTTAYLKLVGGRLATFDFETRNLYDYHSVEEMIEENELSDFELLEVDDFYSNQRWKIAGAETLLGMFFSVLGSLIIVCAFSFLVLRDWQSRNSVQSV